MGKLLTHTSICRYCDGPIGQAKNGNWVLLGKGPLYLPLVDEIYCNNGRMRHPHLPKLR